MSRPIWFVDLLKRVYPARFAAAKMTRIPILGQIADAIFFNHDDVIYLPRDRVIQIHQAVEPPESIVLPSQVVEHFVEQASHCWIMDRCLCRDATQCRDYPIDLGCLFLGQATLNINPALGRQVSQEEALLHLRRCREAGLVHMVGRNKIDTIWMGVSPGSRLLTICNCCPCCCLWGIVPFASQRIGERINRMPGVSVVVNERCTGCGRCTQANVCFMDAIQIVEGRAVISDACRGCGLCVETCPNQAIDLVIEDDDYVRRSIERLSQAVDVR